MIWGALFRVILAVAKVAPVIDKQLGRLDRWNEERKARAEDKGWKYRDVKIANDAAHRAGHEKQ